MKKSFFNNNKGITLVSVAIAVTLILILTGVIIYNVKGIIYIRLKIN